MSGSFRASAGVASIPSNVRKTIQNIREIAGNHSDDEIYAMLRECSMDPNETTQKLLLQDTFHEVKRKRERKKEIPNNREVGDSRWRPGVQGRGGRGGRGSYSPRYVAHDAGGGRNLSAGKENGVSQGIEKGFSSTSSSSVSQDVDNTTNNSILSAVTPLANGPSHVAHGVSTHGRASQVSGAGGNPPSGGITTDDVHKIESVRPPILDVACTKPSPTSPASVSGVYSSASDPVLVPSLDSRTPGVVGAIKREVGSQRLPINQLVFHEPADPELSSNTKATSEIGNRFLPGTVASKSHGVERNQLSEVSHVGSSVNRSSSNYSSRPHQLAGSQKVGPSKEWKPKTTNINSAQASASVSTSTSVPVTDEVYVQSVPASSTSSLEETVSKLEKKLDEFHFSDGQHVIFPNHLQIPESERSGLSFGSFGSYDISFGQSTSIANDHDSEKSSTPRSESSHEIESSHEMEEIAEESSSCIENASPIAQEGDHTENRQSPVHMPEHLSSDENDVSANIAAVPEFDQSKPEVVLTPGGPQYSVVPTGPNYSTFGLMPPILGSQFAPFDSSESQAREAPRLPSFVVQQPLDPSTSFYTPLFRPGTDGDARFSPFLTPGSATKYNPSVALLSSQAGQSPPESGNSLVPSTASPSPLATQAAGVMPSSMAVTPQPLPIFRQPAGVQISHIPPGYFPYNQFLSPFYVQPPIHHFLTNPAFPQQPPAGGIYSSPAAAGGAVKYSLSPYKPGTNSGNSTHIGMPAGYSPYGSTPAGYSPSPAATAGNSTGNEDLSGSQYKENNVYISGQQSEGSGVWVPGRDISGLPVSSFYNLAPQGQHMTFAPTQAGHGAFAGLYHPSQTVAAGTMHPLLQQSQTMAGAVEMVGPQTGVYQQSQRPQVNWANNY